MITLNPHSTRAAAGSALKDSAAEQYYALVHWLRAGGNSEAIAIKTLGITSCARGAGVSTVAMNLAATAAQSSDRPVLLLDLSAVELTRSESVDRSADSCQRDISVMPGELHERVETSSASNLSILRVDRAFDLAFGRENRGVGNLLRSLENDFGFIVVDLPSQTPVCALPPLGFCTECYW